MRIVLTIAIHSDDKTAAGIVDTGLHRGGLTEVSSKINHTDVITKMGAASGKLSCCVVATAIVDRNNLPGNGQGRQCLVQLGNQLAGVTTSL